MRNTIAIDGDDAVEWLVTRPGEHCAIRVEADQTDGVYSVVEIVSTPGDATPMHLHHSEDEYMLVLEGTVRVARGDEVMDVETGGFAVLPRKIPHAWGNRTSSPLRLVFFVTPGGCEDALRQIAKGGFSDPASLIALAQRYNIEVLGPPPF